MLFRNNQDFDSRPVVASGRRIVTFYVFAYQMSQMTKKI